MSVELPQTVTRQGRFLGHAEGKTISYKGIPYAHVRERFRSAEPAAPVGTLDAVSFGPSCPQNGKGHESASEDCLSLNIWVPENGSRYKPVLLFVHGGSFCGGASSARDINGADLAAAGDCIVVSCNYRVGVLGFIDFSGQDERLTANAGLQDVLQALAWVHDNIADFGGDPDNITMIGQSAGATLCSALPVIPKEQQLAKRAILMSAAPTLMSSKEGGRSAAQAFLDLAQTDMNGLLKMPVDELLSFQRRFIRSTGLGAGTYMPTVDGQLIRQYPIAAAASGQINPLPMLIGTTREEMSFLFVPPVAKTLEIDGIMEAGVDAETPEVQKSIAASYERYGRRAQATLISDLVFRMGSVWLAETMSLHADVWMYRFDYETAAMKVSKLHAFHSSDIPFLFGNYREGHAPLMFCFSPSRAGIRRVTQEVRRDFLAFARGEELPWDSCSGENTPAKCYAAKSTVEPCVPCEIKAKYLPSNFYRRSFAGENNNLRAPYAE